MSRENESISQPSAKRARINDDKIEKDAELSGHSPPLTLSELHRLARWNTPTIYNGWEQVTKTNLTDGFQQPFNLEETRDYMPQMGPMCGYAVTVTCEPSNRQHKVDNPDAWDEYRKYVASCGPGPKIVVVQDLDKAKHIVGAFWGEVNSGIHKALGCVGTITDGAIRDVDEMTAVGFKALARRLCVGHAHSHPVSWGKPVEVFGRRIEPGQLIHADKHGFLVIPKGEEKGVLEASVFMDNNECNTMIGASRVGNGSKDTFDKTLERFSAAAGQFGKNVKQHFGDFATTEFDASTSSTATTTAPSVK